MSDDPLVEDRPVGPAVQDGVGHLVLSVLASQGRVSELCVCLEPRYVHPVEQGHGGTRVIYDDLALLRPRGAAGSSIA